MCILAGSRDVMIFRELNPFKNHLILCIYCTPCHLLCVSLLNIREAWCKACFLFFIVKCIARHCSKLNIFQFKVNHTLCSQRKLQIFKNCNSAFFWYGLSSLNIQVLARIFISQWKEPASDRRYFTLLIIPFDQCIEDRQRQAKTV